MPPGSKNNVSQKPEPVNFCNLNCLQRKQWISAAYAVVPQGLSLCFMSSDSTYSNQTMYPVCFIMDGSLFAACFQTETTEHKFLRPGHTRSDAYIRNNINQKMCSGDRRPPPRKQIGQCFMFVETLIKNGRTLLCNRLHKMGHQNGKKQMKPHLLSLYGTNR